ncbi:MAG: hypothetical protein ACLP7P_00285 [Rhodomicrobium sp.]
MAAYTLEGKTNAARAHSSFLLGSQIKDYLEERHKEAFRINATGPLLREASAWTSVDERNSKAAQHGQDKLESADRIGELANKFEPFLCVEDFASSRFFAPWRARSLTKMKS